MDPVDRKIGLSIKAALDEPDPESVQAYFDGQAGSGRATLGDVMDPALFGGGTARRSEPDDEDARDGGRTRDDESD